MGVDGARSKFFKFDHLPADGEGIFHTPDHGLPAAEPPGVGAAIDIARSPNFSDEMTRPEAPGFRAPPLFKTLGEMTAPSRHVLERPTLVAQGESQDRHELAELLNIRLSQMFAKSEHHVVIENVEGQLSFVLRWKNGNAERAPTTLAAFDENNLPRESGDFLIFSTAGKPTEFTVIPVHLRKDYLNAREVVNVELSAEKNKDLFSVKGEPLLADLYAHPVDEHKAIYRVTATLPSVAAVSPAELAESEPAEADEVKLLQPVDQKSVPETEKAFVDQVVEIATAGGTANAKEIEIVFALDISESMAPGAGLVVNTIAEIVKTLTAGGRGVKAGLVVFRDSHVRVQLPLTRINKDGMTQLINSIGSIEFAPGYAPVGEAVLESFDLFSGKSDVTRSVMVLTDSDGLSEDRAQRPIFDHMKGAGNAKGITVGLQLLPDSYVAFVPHQVVAAFQIFKLTGGTSALAELAKNKNHHEQFRLEAVKALAGMNDPRGIEALIELVKSGRGMKIWWEADDTLKETLIASILTPLNLRTNNLTYHVIARTLMDIYRKEGADVLRAMHRLSPDATEFWQVKQTLPVARTLVLRAKDDAIRDKILDILAKDLAAGRPWKAVAAQAKFLLDHQEDLVVGIAGREYRHVSDFAVNESGLHYYVNMERASGERRLAELALTAAKEESWIYLHYVKDGREYRQFFENGIMEEEGRVVSKYDVLAYFLRNDAIQIKGVTMYHIHPRAGDPEGAALPSSPADLNCALSSAGWARDMGYLGPIDSRAVTSTGTNILAATHPVEMRADRGRGENAQAAANDYRSWLDSRDNTAPFMEADAVEGLRASGRVEAAYQYHWPQFMEVESAYKNLHAFYRDEFPKENEALTMDRARKIHDSLSLHHKHFAATLSACRASGVPETVLKFYDEELNKELHYISSLATWLK